MKPRNPVAYALALRGKGKVMKDRRAPREGQTNRLVELLQQAAEEEYREEGPDDEEDGGE